MTRRRARAWAAAAVTAAVFLSPVCGKPSDEAAIHALLEEAVSRAEKRDMAGLLALLASDYRDFQGRDPEATQRLVADYLGQYRGLVIHLLGARIGPIAPDGAASVEFEVALSHGAAETLRRLIRVAGEYYHFRVDLRRSGPAEWRLTYAEWESVDPAGLFPESLQVLRKLFPGF